MGVSSFFFTTRTDVTTSINLAREITTTYLAESVAAQIESRTNRHPWELRFWLIEAQDAGTVTPGSGILPTVTFDRSSGHVDLSADALPGDAYDYTGVVKDLDSGLRTYRIYLEVTLEDEVYSFAWDKRFNQSVLDGMNRENALLDKKLEDVALNSAPTDQLLDEVKREASAPREDTIQFRFKALLDELRADQESIEGSTTVDPDPAEGEPPPDPRPPGALP